MSPEKHKAETSEVVGERVPRWSSSDLTVELKWEWFEEGNESVSNDCEKSRTRSRSE